MNLAPCLAAASVPGRLGAIFQMSVRAGIRSQRGRADTGQVHRAPDGYNPRQVKLSFQIRMPAYALETRSLAQCR
jgi:hypothetical protein